MTNMVPPSSSLGGRTTPHLIYWSPHPCKIRAGRVGFACHVRISVMCRCFSNDEAMGVNARRERSSKKFSIVPDSQNIIQKTKAFPHVTNESIDQ